MSRPVAAPFAPHKLHRRRLAVLFDAVTATVSGPLIVIDWRDLKEYQRVAPALATTRFGDVSKGRG